ncbi:MAG: hypothetical protein AAF728_06165 [Cyanobacteria bacterium P01_D01_bin.128]
MPEVYLLPSTFPVSYRSAIARQLCARWQRPLPNVIEQLRQVLQPAESTLSDINLGAELLDKQRHSIPAPRETKNIENLDFTFAISETGWLEATLTLPALTQWLNELNQLDSVIQAKTDCPVQPLIKPDCFRWQHLHARCCFHLRVSEQQGMIKLSSASPRSPLQIVNPDPLPWDAQLQPDEPALKRYKAQIQTVMAIWDRLALLKGDRRVKQLAAQLDRLCDQTETADRLRSPLGFWQQASPCTLDPEAAAYQSSLRQLELSLVRTVQVTVKHALMEGLGAIAPQEL